MNINDIKINFLLDLFEAGFKNAYVSLIHNDLYYRIEIVLPNVGRLCLYQTFVDVLDEQLPHIDIFYSAASEMDKETQITDIDLLKRATKIIYEIRDYFEKHPEYCVTNKDLIKTIKNNQELLKKLHTTHTKKHWGILQTFVKEK